MCYVYTHIAREYPDLTALAGMRRSHLLYYILILELHKYKKGPLSLSLPLEFYNNPTHLSLFIFIPSYSPKWRSLLSFFSALASPVPLLATSSLSSKGMIARVRRNVSMYGITPALHQDSLKQDQSGLKSMAVKARGYASIRATTAAAVWCAVHGTPVNLTTLGTLVTASTMTKERFPKPTVPLLWVKEE